MTWTPKFNKGQKVRLPANEKEGWAEEFAAVVDAQEKPGMYMIVVFGAEGCGCTEIHEDDMAEM